jgi:hypothetical protein
MSCEERFYDYIDYVKGKLPLDISLEIDKHVLSCDRCKEEIENIKSFSLTLDNFNVKEPNENYFIKLLPIINERIANKEKIKFENVTYNMLFSVVSVIIFAVILIFTYNISNTQIPTETFANYDIELSIDNYNLLGYTTYENIDNNVEKRVTEAIAGLLFQEHEDWFSSQENVKSYVADFSDDELDNVIDKLNNTHLLYGEK